MSTADWHPLFDRFYRKCELYDMQWTGVNINTSKVAGAPFGGPIAIVRDQHAAGSSSAADVDSAGRPRIRLFTSAGMLLASFVWEVASAVVAMSWTAKEQLVVVAEDGTVVLYSVHGEKLSTFSALPASVRSDGVAEVDFWPGGLVVRTGLKSELWAITSWTEPRPQRLADASAALQSPPTAMTVLATESKCEVLLATATGSIIVVDARQAEDQLLQSGPFARMALSPSGSMLAAFSDDGTLHVMSTDFKNAMGKFSTGSRVPPSHMAWCGEEAILLGWGQMILLVGLLGDFVKFSTENQGGACVFVPEFDGARIVSNTTCEWVARVSDATDNIFRIGSTAPAAQLFDAQEAFENGDAHADDSLRALAAGDGTSGGSNALKTAIDQCLQAAAFEFDFEVQRSLLKAASFGKLVCPAFKADKFVDMCRVLRVLNAVRSPDVGMPLTHAQFVALEAETLVDRLVNRHAHLLALRICEYLRIHPERVLVHWACVRVKAAEELSDVALGEQIVAKLRVCPGISFAPIASTAFRHGRRALATYLLEFEPLAADQVPLLMSMQEDELALGKAIASGDTDLVYLALLHLKKHRKQKDFFGLIKDKPLARDLYISYCKQVDLPALKQFYYFLQQPSLAASVAVLEAYQCDELKDRLAGLAVALEFYEKDKGVSASSAAAARAVEDEMLLLKVQRETESKTGESGLVDLSVTQTMERFVQKGDSARVAAIKTALKVGDRRVWHVEVLALARGGCWEELSRLVSSSRKPPPIGFEPFIEACLACNAPGEAAKYIARLPEYHEQMEWYCNIGYWDQAADVAARERDVDALQLLRGRCRQPMVQQKIDRVLQMISQQGGK